MNFKLVVAFMFISINISLCQTWTNIYPNPSEFYYRAMYMDTTGLGIFVGTEDIITKTNDFGNTFTNINKSFFSRLNAIERVNDSIFITLGNYSVLRSSDKGESWVDLNINIEGSLRSVKFIDDSRGFIVGSDGIVLRSDDDGVEWSRILSNQHIPFTHVNFINDSLGFIWGAHSRFYKTENRGDSWEEVYLGLDSDINYIHFKNESNGLLFLQKSALTGIVYETHDGGGSWTVINYHIPGLRGVRFLNDSIGFGSTLIGDFYKTENGGMNWERLFQPRLASSNSFYIVNKDLILAATSNNILLSSDLGQNWDTLSTSLHQDLNKGIFVNDNEIYVVGKNGSLLKSDDTGVNYFNIETEIITNWNDIVVFGKNRVIVIGDSSIIIKSDDGGLHWDYITLDVGNLRSMSQINNSIWIVSDLGYLIHSVDSGTTWSQYLIDSVNLPRYVYYISESNGFIIHENNKVSRTINGGESWDIIDLINYSNGCIHFIDNQIGYIAGDRIYKTVDGGSNWEILSSDLPLHYFQSMFFRDENVGYISGEYGVIMKTVNGGLSWEFNTTYTHNFLTSIQFNENGVGTAVGFSGTILRIEEGDIIIRTTEQPSNTSNITLFPNPTSDFLTLRSENINRHSSIQIFDINGRQRSSIKEYHTNNPINIKFLPVGTYILLHSNDEIIEKSLFIKY